MYTRAKDGEIIKTRTYDDKNIAKYNKQYLNILIKEASSIQKSDLVIEDYINNLKTYLSKIR